MKKYIIYIIMILVSVTAVWANYVPEFLQLEANQTSYELGDRALLMAHVRIKPTNPNMELYFSSRFKGAHLAIDAISSEELVSFTPELDKAGTFEWVVYVYMQDKHVAESLQLSKIKLEQENIKIDQELVGETDPEVRELLLQMKARNNIIISKINSQIKTGRRLLQTLKLNVVVNKLAVKSQEIPVLLDVKLDREDHTYYVGEQINFVVTRTCDLLGSESLEYVLKAKLHNRIISLFATDNEYITNGQSQVLETSQTGERVLSVSLSIRPKEKAENLRTGILMAQKKRAEYIELKNDCLNDSIRQDYYELKIRRMKEVVANYYEILESILDLVTTNESMVFINK